MKRFLSIILATLMVLALVSFARTEVARAEPEIWDGTIATGYAGGDGSEDNPYQIANGAQLAYLAQQTSAIMGYSTGKYFKLTADIVLNDTSNWESWGSLDGNGDIIVPANVWTPIGVDSVSSFHGNFNGNNKVVSGIYIDSDGYLGLFGYCIDVTINGVGVTESYIKGGESSTVGGVVSLSYRTSITSCYNTGTVSGGNYVGGVIGNCPQNSSIANCYNTGAVSGRNYVGGVIGSCPQNSSITNCHNTGTVSGTEEQIGGLVGRLGGSSVITICYNSGAVIGGSSVGGVVGSGDCYITNCYNTGTVSGVSRVGGVVGYSVRSTTKCYNTGAVSGTGERIGGVIGCALWECTTANCYNTGAVSGTNYVGGVAGLNQFSNVSTCYNVGNIISTGSYAGGVAGCNQSESGRSATIENCYYLDTCGASVGAANFGGGGTATITNLISLTSEQLKDESNYVGFDFTGNPDQNIDPVWTMVGNPNYLYAELYELRHVVPVTGITATENIELGIGGTDTIEYTITPSDAYNQNVSFVSSDATVATVSDAGVVTGVAEGSATITTTTEDGGFTDTTTVTVHADCTVTYIADSTQVAQYEVRWGDTLETIPDVPDKAHHITVGWDRDLAGLAIKQDYEVTAIYTALLYGDANCDNEVGANDASLILRYVVGLSDISELGCIQGDVTPVYNLAPDSADAAAILRLLVELIPNFPIQNGN
ncbi:MAG: GLUG motif-containing protein [Clostridia bacterium]|nr:GLUG motif-containing protein [Clostridia bacterium]